MNGAASAYIVFGLMVLAIVVVWVVIASVYGAKAEAKRREGLRALVRESEWTLDEEPDRTLQDRYTGKPFLWNGRGRVKDLVNGYHRGRAFMAFQFSYTQSTGKSSTTYFFTHVATPLPGPAPRVEIKGRGVGSAIAQALGMGPVKLGDPAFDETYVVRTDDQEFAHALLQGGLARWLTGRAFPEPLVVDGSELRTWSGGKLEPDTFPGLLDYLCDAMEQVPGELWQARRG